MAEADSIGDYSLFLHVRDGDHIRWRPEDAFKLGAGYLPLFNAVGDLMLACPDADAPHRMRAIRDAFNQGVEAPPPVFTEYGGRVDATAFRAWLERYIAVTEPSLNFPRGLLDAVLAAQRRDEFASTAVWLDVWLDGLYDRSLASLPAPIRRWHRADLKLMGWGAKSPEERRQAVHEFVSNANDPNVRAQRTVGWYDTAMEASTWYRQERTEPVHAAMLLCGFNPNKFTNFTKDDAKPCSNDEMGPQDFERLKNLFGSASPEPRRLKDWADCAERADARIHSWYRKWEQAKRRVSPRFFDDEPTGRPLAVPHDASAADPRPVEQVMPMTEDVTTARTRPCTDNLADARQAEGPALETPQPAPEDAQDADSVLASLFDQVTVAALEKMFYTNGQWRTWAERAKRNGLSAARKGRAKFNPYLAARWFLGQRLAGWDWAHCIRVLANNLPPRSMDRRHLLTGNLPD